jgi:hypothetical protein
VKQSNYRKASGENGSITPLFQSSNF